jgi:pimeloyl-ACP methyl ester carboxylesterase
MIMPRRRGTLAAVALMSVLGAGAQAQDSEVSFTIGTKPVIQKAKASGYARYFLTYIAHAVESYRDLKDLDPNPEVAGNFRHQAAWDESLDPAVTKLRLSAANRLKSSNWTFVGGYSGVLLCKLDKVTCLLRPIPARGLAYQFWKRNDCSRIAIVFRGTDPTSFTDWYANFRWATRVLPFADEYDIVRQNIDRIVGEAQLMSGCPYATIFAVGHSLGGGLAQLAAYSHGGIRHVYAFNSSPVTAFYDVDQVTRERNKKGLIIDRVYEKGEVLAVPRRLTELFFQPTECDPQVRTVEFNTATGFALANNPVSQHSIDRLWAGLSEFATKAPARLRIPGLTNRDPLGCELDPTKGVGRRVARAERKQRIVKQRTAPPPAPYVDRTMEYAAIR